MIRNFEQFGNDINNILKDIKEKYNEDYINQYIQENFYEYCDDEEMEEHGYDDQVSYYKEMGAGGNGIEYDLIQQIWDYIKDKYNVDLGDKQYNDLRYSIEYHIKDFFPYFEVIDYRKKNDLTSNWDL